MKSSIKDPILKNIQYDFSNEIIKIIEEKYDPKRFGSLIESLPELKDYIVNKLQKKGIIDKVVLSALKILKSLAILGDTIAKEMLTTSLQKILEKKERISLILFFDFEFHICLPSEYIHDFIDSYKEDYAIRALMKCAVKDNSYKDELNKQTVIDLVSLPPVQKPNLFLYSRGELIYFLLLEIFKVGPLKTVSLNLFKDRLNSKENGAQLLQILLIFMDFATQDVLIEILGENLYHFYDLLYKIVEFDKKRIFGHLDIEHIVKGSMSKFISEKIVEEIERNDFDRFYLTYENFFECITKPDLIQLFLENGTRFFSFILSNLTENGYVAINESEFYFSLKTDPDVIDCMRSAAKQLLKRYKFREGDPIFNIELLKLLDHHTLQDLLNNPKTGFFESLLDAKGRWDLDYYHKFLEDKNLSFKTSICQVFKSNKVEDISLFWKYWVWDDLKISELKWLLENKDLNFLEKLLKNAYHYTDDYFFYFYYIIPDRVKTHLRSQLKENTLQILNKIEIDTFVPLLAMRLLDCFDPEELLSIIEDNEINLLERIDEAIEEHYDKILELNEGFYRWKINFYKFLSKFNIPISEKIDRLEAAETLTFQFSPQDEEIEDSEFDFQTTSHIEEHVVIAGKKIEVINGILDLSGLNLYTIENIENLFELKSLRVLSLSNNYLTKLPFSIGNLTSLEKLLIEKCNINKLPKSIGNLKNLKHLNLYRNQINEFPESFGNLEKIEYLDASFNNILYIPDFFKKLTSLKVLNLRNNSIKNIPEWIGEFRNLKVLNLMVNQLISKLPTTIGDLVSLEELKLGSTWINTVPDSIGNLKNLKFLSLSNTHITELPESIGNLQSLEQLYIHSDNIISILNTILECTSLNYLEIGRETFEHHKDLMRTLEKNGVTVYH